jgi:hypothetical protein
MPEPAVDDAIGNLLARGGVFAADEVAAFGGADEGTGPWLAAEPSTRGFGGVPGAVAPEGAGAALRTVKVRPQIKQGNSAPARTGWLKLSIELQCGHVR